MKKVSIVLGLSVCVISLVASIAYADDFSFIGINWNDNLGTVIEKILKSGYASDVSERFLKKGQLEIQCGHLTAILMSPMVDKGKFDSLLKVGSGQHYSDLQIDNIVKDLRFLGKRDSIVKEAKFWFPCKGDTLLAYNIELNSSIVEVNEDTGDSQVYQSLVKKYGNPTRRIQYSRVWSKQDQTLYYWAVAGKASLIYMSERNLSNYIASIKGKEKELEGSSKKKQADSVRKDF